MAYTKLTLSDLQQALADKISAGVVPTSSEKISYWNRMLNDGQDYCARRLNFKKSTALTTVSGAISFPDDFKSVEKVVDEDGNELLQISKEDSASASGSCFWVTGNHLDGYTLNTPDDVQYTVWYNFHPAKMVNTTDECIISDPVAVVCYAYSKLRKAQTDPLEDAEKEMGECELRINEMELNEIKNDEGILRMKLPANS